MPRSAFVFVSQPTSLTQPQTAARQVILDELVRHGLSPRTVGVTDHTTKNPLSEVCILARHCSGGLVLGFKQVHAERVTMKPGTDAASEAQSAAFASQWNQLESGVLFSMRLPLLVIRENGISGGIFDPGAGDHYVKSIDLDRLEDPEALDALRQIVESWAGDVWQSYRSVWS
jgi:hypothetical protein